MNRFSSGKKDLNRKEALDSMHAGRPRKGAGRRMLSLLLAAALVLTGTVAAARFGGTRTAYADDLKNTVPEGEYDANKGIVTYFVDNPDGLEFEAEYGPGFGPFKVDGVIQSRSKTSATDFAAGLPISTIYIDQSKIQSGGAGNSNAVPGKVTIFTSGGAVRPGFYCDESGQVWYDGRREGASLLVPGKINEIKGDLYSVLLSDAAILPDGTKADMEIVYSNLRIAIDQRYASLPEGKQFYNGPVGISRGATFTRESADGINFWTKYRNTLDGGINQVAGKYNTSFSSQSIKTPCVGVALDATYRIVNKDGSAVDGTFIYAICGINLDRDPGTRAGNNVGKTLWYTYDKNFGGEDGTVYNFFSEAMSINSGQVSDYIYVRPNNSIADNPDAGSSIRERYLWANVDKMEDGRILFTSNANQPIGSSVNYGGIDTSYSAGFVTLADAKGFTVTAVGHGAVGYGMNAPAFNSDRLWYKYTASTGPGGMINTTSEGNFDGSLDDGGEIIAPDILDEDADPQTSSKNFHVVPKGKAVTYTMKPDYGYKLKLVMINGEVIYDGSAEAKEDTPAETGDAATGRAGSTSDGEGTFKMNDNGSATFRFRHACRDEDIHVEWIAGLVDIPVEKSWKDSDDQDGIRPEKAEVKLLTVKGEAKEPAIYIDGTPVGSIFLSEDNGWKSSFEGVPYKDGEGNKIKYVVEEVKTDVITGTDAEGTYAIGITGSAKDGYIVSNTHTPETVSIEGSKVWDDNNDQDGKRPESFTVRLHANGKLVEGKDLKVTEADGWKFKFSDLPKYDAGHEIHYSVTEDGIHEYSTKIDEHTCTITNYYTPGRTSVSVEKEWEDDYDRNGKRPSSVTVTLLADGKPYKYAVLTEANEWEYNFNELPEKQDGKDIVYTVREDVVAEGYDVSYSGGAVKGFVIVYTYEDVPETVSIKGSKVWDDNDDQDGKRPESFTVRLHANGKLVSGKTIVVTEADGWKFEFSDLPKYDAGHEIHYTVTEDAIPEYSTKIDEHTYTITNYYTPGKTSVSVEKEWEDDYDKNGKRPSSVTVTLLADGKPYKYAVLTEANEWEYNFNELPEKKDGKDIVYTVREDVEADGYTVSYSGDAVKGFVIVNTLNEVSPVPAPPAEPEPPQDPDVSPTPEEPPVVPEEEPAAPNEEPPASPDTAPRPKPGEAIDDPNAPAAPYEEDSSVETNGDPNASVEEESEMSEENVPHSPFTGDDRHTVVWSVLSILSLAGIVILSRSPGRRGKHERR